MRIGFLINPIAGMGGRVGLKGTDGVVSEAYRLGARPIAEARAMETLRTLRQRIDLPGPIEWITCSGEMGEAALIGSGFDNIAVVHQTSEVPSQSDTEQAVRAFLDANVELIVFCGGDGTARDVALTANDRIPIIGIPSGVKMYSGVFGVSPRRTAEIIAAFMRGVLSCARVDILDLDEEKYRRDEWAVRLVTSATTPFEPTYTQAAKALLVAESDIEIKTGIARDVQERINANPETVYILGPGSTVQFVANYLGLEKTLLSIDALLGNRIIARNLNEAGLLELTGHHADIELILSPIGAQGFVLGRGNLQISPDVMRCIGMDHVTVLATPAKLERLQALRFDTGDAALDRTFARRRYLPVTIGYRRRRLVPVEV